MLSREHILATRATSDQLPTFKLSSTTLLPSIVGTELAVDAPWHLPSITNLHYKSQPCRPIMATLNSYAGSPHASLSTPNLNAVMPPVPTLQPTWRGYVQDTKDALILFEGAIGGTLARVVRRPHDRERTNLIKSGSVFIYEESASGIKRWTDGVPWSPSRILGNFLIYRELEKPFPPGEKKRATKKSKRDHRPSDPYPVRPATLETGSSTEDTTAQQQTSNGSPSSEQTLSPTVAAERDAERLLVGSLTDSYQFKSDGLVKKTMSVKINDIPYHLVSYYMPQDVKAKLLTRPVTSSALSHLIIRPELITKQNFRAPIDEQMDEGLGAYGTPMQSYGGASMPYYPSQQSAYMPQHQSSYSTASGHHPSFSAASPHAASSSSYASPTAPYSATSSAPYSATSSGPYSATSYQSHNTLPTPISGSSMSSGPPLSATTPMSASSYHMPQHQTQLGHAQPSYITSASPGTDMTSPTNTYWSGYAQSPAQVRQHPTQYPGYPQHQQQPQQPHDMRMESYVMKTYGQDQTNQHPQSTGWPPEQR